MSLATRFFPALDRLTVRTVVLWSLAGLVASACVPGTAPGSSHAQPSDASGSVIATIRVADTETYRILLTEPEDVTVARDLLAGAPAPPIPNGRVIRAGDGGVNTGYSWYIDPTDIEWADSTIEVCDGLPSDVESSTITSDRFCPWTARVIAVDPA